MYICVVYDALCIEKVSTTVIVWIRLPLHRTPWVFTNINIIFFIFSFINIPNLIIPDFPFLKYSNFG